MPPAQAAEYGDGDWMKVDLPHDWSIAGPIARENPAGSPGGFFPTGVGWYRKSFLAPADWAGRHVAIQFDGVYMLSDVYVNGTKLGTHASGFTPFEYDFTPHLKLSQSNTVAVRVDNSRQQNCRWYSGSGIYRHVRLAVREPIHMPQFGVFIRTNAVNNGAAELSMSVPVKNAGQPTADKVKVETRVFAADASGRPTGTAIAVFDAVDITLAENAGTVETKAVLPNAKLWSPESPAMYVAVTTLAVDGRTVDTRQTPFGVRTIAISAERGFELNGKPVELYGACVHDDNSGLGVAAFDRAEVRRVEWLKAAGFNAVRCAHNPPAPAFLDACDRLGLLVIDEAFDTWSLPKNPGDFGTYFKEQWQSELDKMILRDRNHPSIIIWSLGNEIVLWGRETARAATDGAKLIRRAKELDPTRFTTTAVAGWNLPDKPWEQMTPLLNQFDLVGYNYVLHRYETDHAAFPGRAIVGTESFPRDVFETFDTADRLTHVIGDFVWTGIDYFGESGIGRYHQPDEKIHFHLDPRHYPYHGAYCGDIDITGFRKPISYARNITWGRGETLYTSVTELTPDGRKYRVAEWGVVPTRASWTWPGFEGRSMEVVVYSRHDAVRLYLNDRLIGEKGTTRADHFKAVFSVPYEAGTLRTVGMRGGKEVETNTLRTAGPVAGLRLKVDRTQIDADGQDLAFVTVESIDANGDFQPNGDQNVTFTLDGPATIAGVASADFNNTDGYQVNHRRLFNGRAELIVRSSKTAGRINVQATAEGLKAATAAITAR
ncbi:MAG: glycoside hydrolase family 2 TIM barrel-domain containing protein [Tepidisphaeraceae bacterium]